MNDHKLPNYSWNYQVVKTNLCQQIAVYTKFLQIVIMLLFNLTTFFQLGVYLFNVVLMNGFHCGQEFHSFTFSVKHCLWWQCILNFFSDFESFPSGLKTYNSVLPVALKCLCHDPVKNKIVWNEHSWKTRKKITSIQCITFSLRNWSLPQ